MRLLGPLILLALLPACGGQPCGVPELVVSPSEARPGEPIEVHPAHSLAPCVDDRTGSLFRPLPRNTLELDVMLALAGTRPDGGPTIRGEAIPIGQAGYDDVNGTFELSAPVPERTLPGDYVVFLRQQPEARGLLRVVR